MKTISLIILIVIFSCDSAKKPVENPGINTNQKTVSQTFQCPEKGKCSWELLHGKSLVIKTDGIGMSYPKLTDNPETSVVKFRYHRDSPKGVSDGQYTEEVYFEINNGIEKLTLHNEDLQKVKLLYGRMCFCERGSVGYFKVEEGTLNYSKNKNGEALISLAFQNNQVPQVIQNLQGEVVFR